MKKRQLLLVAFFLCKVCGCKAKPHPMVGEDKDWLYRICWLSMGKEKQCVRS